MVSLKKRMLFVDDRSKRIHAALNQYSPDYDVTIATNVREALRLMSSQEFDVVSLDHDLNGCDFEDPDSPTCGMEIVRYIQKTGWPTLKRIPVFWVHSKNLFASYLMCMELRGIFRHWDNDGTLLDKHIKQIPFVYDNVEHMKYDDKGIPNAHSG